jgi:uncharacterized protein
MGFDILEEYIKQHIEASTGDTISFSWHGGEPLLAGIGFYRKALEFQSVYKPEDTVILNGIQTNGTLINEDWCSFLAEENFLTGISIDGPADLHNTFRRKKGKDTFEDVIAGYEMLQSYGLKPEILCVVNDMNVKYPFQVYDFFKKLDPEFITFIPLVEPEAGSESGVSVRSVKAIEFGNFLSEIFDIWVVNDIGKIKIQVFEEALRSAFGQEHTLCIFREECGRVPVVEHNGDFYSCDHYVNSDHLLGNIMDLSVSQYLEGERQKSFGRAKLTSLPQYCINCEVRPMCNGECPKNRIITSPGGEPGLNYLCAGYKYFFNHCLPFIRTVSAVWKNSI